MKKQDNMLLPREHLYLQDPELKGIYEMTDKESKIIIIRKLNDMQENTDTQNKARRKAMSDMNENITEETELIRKNQT